MSQPPIQQANLYLRYGLAALIAIGLLGYLVSSVCAPEFCARNMARDIAIMSVVILVPIIVVGFRVMRLQYSIMLRERHAVQIANARARRIQLIGLLLFAVSFLFIMFVAPSFRTSTPQIRAIVVLPAGILMMTGIGLFGYARFAILRIVFNTLLRPLEADDKSTAGNIKFGPLVFWIVIALLLVAFFNFAGERSGANKVAINLITNLFPWILIVGVWVYFMVQMRRERKRGAEWPAYVAFTFSDVKPIMWIEDALIVVAILWIVFALRLTGASGPYAEVETFGIPGLLLFGAFAANLWARHRPPT